MGGSYIVSNNLCVLLLTYGVEPDAEGLVICILKRQH